MTVRQIHSAEEITAEVDRLLHESVSVKEDGAAIRVPRPTPLQMLDENGCNWTMTYFNGGFGYNGPTGEAVGAVKAKWNLR